MVLIEDSNRSARAHESNKSLKERESNASTGVGEGDIEGGIRCARAGDSESRSVGVELIEEDRQVNIESFESDPGYVGGEEDASNSDTACDFEEEFVELAAEDASDGSDPELA